MTTETTDTVETPQTFAEYKAARLAPPVAAPAPAPADEIKPIETLPSIADEEGKTTDIDEGNDEASDVTTTPPAKPKRSLEGRFSELTGRAKAAEARAAEAEARAAELEAKLKPAVPKEDAEPEASAYTDAFEYARALAKWTTTKALKDRDEAQAKQAIQQSWNTRLTAVKAEISDFEDILAEAGDVSISDVLRDAVVESDVGPRILYHLAKNPDEADRLNQLSPAAALRALGRLEAKIEQAAAAPVPAPKPAPAPKAAPAPRAPQPVTPVNAKASIDNKVNSAGEFEGSFAQYKALRAQGKI